MNLRELRERWGMTQIEMASLIHVSRTTWQGYEAGTRPVPLAALELLAYKLKDKANEMG